MNSLLKVARLLLHYDVKFQGLLLLGHTDFVRTVLSQKKPNTLSKERIAGHVLFAEM